MYGVKLFLHQCNFMLASANDGVYGGSGSLCYAFVGGRLGRVEDAADVHLHQAKGGRGVAAGEPQSRGRLQRRADCQLQRGARPLSGSV